MSGDNGPSPIFDVSAPHRPRLLGRYEFEGGNASAVLVERDLAIVTSMSDLILYDVSNPAEPRRIGRYKGIPSFDPKEFQFDVVVAAKGRRMLVSYETRPSQLVDVSVPALPRLLATFTPRGRVHSSVLTSTHAALGYAAGTNGEAHGGVEIMDLQDSSQPRSLAVLELDQPVSKLVIRANRLVAAHPGGALTIIDVQDWKRPKVLGRLPAIAPGAAPYVALSEDGRNAYLVCADGASPDRGALTVIDLHDTGSPRAVGRLEIRISGGTAMPLAVQGNDVVILAGLGGGVAVVDATNRASQCSLASRPCPVDTPRVLRCMAVTF